MVLPQDEAAQQSLYQARVNYGYALLEVGNLSAAATQFERALDVRPGGAEAQAGLEQARVRLTPTPTNRDALVQALAAAWEREDWPEAIRILEALRALEPQEPEWTTTLYSAHVNYGYALLAAQNEPGARDQFLQALRYNPQGAEALTGLAAISGVTPTPPPSDFILYTVQAGDTIFSIARRYDVSVEAIIQANNLTTYALTIGQQLRIPTP